MANSPKYVYLIQDLSLQLMSRSFQQIHRRKMLLRCLQLIVVKEINLCNFVKKRKGGFFTFLPTSKKIISSPRELKNLGGGGGEENVVFLKHVFLIILSILLPNLQLICILTYDKIVLHFIV